jgi:hypothetical protein
VGGCAPHPPRGLMLVILFLFHHFLFHHFDPFGHSLGVGGDSSARFLPYREALIRRAGASWSAETTAGEHVMYLLAFLVVGAVQQAQVLVEGFEDFGGGGGVVFGQQKRTDVAAQLKCDG